MVYHRHMAVCLTVMTNPNHSQKEDASFEPRFPLFLSPMSFHLFFYQDCYWLSFLGCLCVSFMCKLSIKSCFKSLRTGGEMVQWWRHLPLHLESWGGSLGPTERKDRTNTMHFPLTPAPHTDKHIFSTLFLRHGWFLKELGAHDSASLATKWATGLPVSGY